MRARGHSLVLHSSPADLLAVHCSRCDCLPLFNNLTILVRNKNKTAREILSKGEGECVNAPSVQLGDDEVLCIKNMASTCGRDMT